MKIYISGPMTGIADLNKKAFSAAAERIKSKGHEPVNPHEVCASMPDYLKWEEYMKADLKSMLDCDAIYMLDNWENSRCANLELDIAQELNMRIYFQTEDLL